MDEKIINRNRNINRGFRTLEIWKIAIEIYFLVHEILSKKHNIPFKVEPHALTDVAPSFSRAHLPVRSQSYAGVPLVP